MSILSIIFGGYLLTKSCRRGETLPLRILREHAYAMQQTNKLAVVARRRL